YKHHRFPVEIISHAVWLDFRFCLSCRVVEDILWERGVLVPSEAMRQWWRKFGQQAADLVDQGGSLLDQSTAHPVDRLDILTLYRLKRHEPHVGTAYCFTNRFSITTVVLIPFDVGLHKLRANELSRVPQLLKLPCPNAINNTSGLQTWPSGRLSKN